MNKRIAILQRIVPHYRVGFFEKFCKRFPEAKIFYGQHYKNESLQNASGLSDKNFVKCRNIYFDNMGKIFFSMIYSKLNRVRPNIVIPVFNVGNLNIYILLLLKKIFKFRIILWSFGYDPEKGFNPEKRFTDKVRLFLSQKADAVIFYWENGRMEVERYSKKSGHYFVAPNTLDTERQIELKEEFDKTGKGKIKYELKINNKFHFIYVGRLLKDKQIDILLKAFSSVEMKKSNCRLTIIGDGPEKNHLIKLSNDMRLSNISFIGEILNDELTGKWIYISDAFVMPGRLGLSVVHSFCFGTPVISQRKGDHFHGEGIGYVKEGKNGFLTEDGNEKDLAAKMIEIISDPLLSEKLRLGAFETVKNECSIDKMLNGFESAVEYVSKKN